MDEGLTIAIDRLFNTYPDLCEYFKRDKKKYVEDTLRQNLMYYEYFIRSKDLIVNRSLTVYSRKRRSIVIDRGYPIIANLIVESSYF